MSRIREFNLPDLGEGLTEGEILKWLVAEGETITLNQPIVEVETAKAAVEIPAKWAGQVTRIFHPEGTTVEVGSPIIAIDTHPSAARTAVLVGYGPRTTTAKRRPRSAATAAVVRDEPAPVTGGPVLAKPPVRKLARDLGVDLAGIRGTGPDGSITRDDVAGARPAPAAVQASRIVLTGERVERVPVKGVRKLTAENMVASAFTAPHVTQFVTVDVTRSMKALEKLKAHRDWRDVHVSPLLLVAKAVLLAIRRYPMVNSTWAGDEIVVKHHVNLGIAAATQRGLIVPNIKDAGACTVRELADALDTLVATARDGRTPPADLTGGTFTITNVGVFGVDTGTPILPPGESAILVLGAIREQPWVHRGKVKSRRVSTLGVSFDHRVVDGELGSRFLRDVGAFLEDPELALLAWG
ncbi:MULTISPECIES: dihydrolipoamide acetyltransferase family protein [unclassified Micromonospora]|uniref:dihydrolipoamide acetyltransferase family protein n=1 Tax=unclassified Micromonospora TaxID=2617518 RepID=UPI0036412202